MLDLKGPVILRPFELADARKVEPWLTGPGLSLPSGRAQRDWPQRLLADTRIVAGIAEANGREVGFVRLDCGPDMVAELTMVIAPDCRRCGLGRAMFEAALRQAGRRGIRRFLALVDIGNQPALQFFAALGFENDGVIGDRVRMSRIVHAGGDQVPLYIEV
jgi:GNAT superfamily N-acetyltransferase